MGSHFSSPILVQTLPLLFCLQNFFQLDLEQHVVAFLVLLGKWGAIIGSIGFLWASHDHKEDGYPKAIGMTASLVILGVVCIMGLLVPTFFTRETMGRSLEENENDN